MATIGVDFGNKSSCVAYYRSDNEIEIVLNDHGNRRTPSFLTFTNEGRLVGEEAQQKLERSSGDVIYDIKKLLGKNYEDVSEIVNQWPFIVIESDRLPVIRINCAGIERTLAPEELAGMLLNDLRRNVESFLGTQVEGIVMTVPAHATESLRRALIRSAALAGLRVVKLLNATTAAALHHCLVHPALKEKKLVVFDQGGHTLDVTVLTVDTRANLTVRATAFAMIGGDDFDKKLAQYLADEFERTTGLNVEGDRNAFNKLLAAAEKAKTTLSFLTETVVFVESLSNGIDLQLLVSRAQFENAALELFTKSMEPVQRALTDARISPSSVDKVLLVGGSSRLPRIRYKLLELFGDKLDATLNPEEAVARGAAAYAAGTTIKIKDICPQAFSVAAKGGLAAVLVPRLSTLPLKRGRAFHTAGDGQIIIKVLEGDRPRVHENKTIGQFELKDVTPNKLHLQFDIDDDGLLTVTAADTRKGTIELIRTDILVSEERAKRMLSASERYKDEDDELKNRAVGRSQLETNAVDLRNSINEELKTGRLTSKDGIEILKTVTRTLRWLKSETGLKAHHDEILQYQSELLQASLPLFRAKSILSPNTNAFTSIIPLSLGEPLKHESAINHLLTLGQILAEDDEPVPGPSRFDDEAKLSDGSSSTASLEDTMNIVRDILGVEVPDSDLDIEGELIESDALLQKVMQEFHSNTDENNKYI